MVTARGGHIQDVQFVTGGIDAHALGMGDAKRPEIKTVGRSGVSSSCQSNQNILEREAARGRSRLPHPGAHPFHS